MLLATSDYLLAVLCNRRTHLIFPSAFSSRHSPAPLCFHTGGAISRQIRGPLDNFADLTAKYLIGLACSQQYKKWTISRFFLLFLIRNQLQLLNFKLIKIETLRFDERLWHDFFYKNQVGHIFLGQSSRSPNLNYVAETQNSQNFFLDFEFKFGDYDL
jgi:hypothetical protein